MTITTAVAELDAFAERRADLQRSVASLEAQRADLQSSLTDALSDQLLDGRSTSKRQETLRRQLATLDEQIMPQRRALDEAAALFARAQQTAARRQFDAAAKARDGLVDQNRGLVDDLVKSLDDLLAINRRLAELRDADRDAYEAQRAAVGLGRLVDEVPTTLPVVSLDGVWLTALAEQLQADRKRMR